MLVNKKISRDYNILETYEAGIALKGSEVKSIREGRVSFTDSFVRIKKGEAWLSNLHITPYSQGTGDYNPKRDRKLLLHKREIKKLTGALPQKGLTLLPLRIYFKRNKVKLQIGLAKGKRKYDKREAIKRRDIEREMRREIKERR